MPPKRLGVDESSLEKIIQGCSSTMDKLLIMLLSSTGLRASEACNLKLDDIELPKGVLVVRQGKGNKIRHIGLSPKLVTIIQAYVDQCHNKTQTPYLLHHRGIPLTRHGLHRRVMRIGSSVGMPLSPHSLRRSFVTINANKGRPLVMLQIACGHSDIKTTRSYCLTSEQEVVEAMQGWDI